MAFLTDDNFLSPHLWFDAPDAQERLLEMEKQKQLKPGEAQWIRHFMTQGYGMLEVAGVDRLADQLLQEVDALWQAAPFDLSMAGPAHGRPLPMQEGVKFISRGPGVRLMDIHSHCPAALSLYLLPELHRMCSLLFGAPAIATQSLFFEYGSTQNLHRDPWYVNHNPRSHLLAAWIALEDISPDAGPLMYVPGSHKLPYYRFQETNDIVFHHPSITAQERTRAYEEMLAQIANAGMKPAPALPKKGQIFVWHGSLIHGGSLVNNPALSRNSFVLHFGRSDTHLRRGATLHYQDQAKAFFTHEQYKLNTGELGWHNPLEHLTREKFQAA